MKETTLIIDEATGALTVEGLNDETLNRIAGDLLPQPAHVNCARPMNVPPAISASKMLGKMNRNYASSAFITARLLKVSAGVRSCNCKVASGAASAATFPKLTIRTGAF
jgi:hypothetical protein